MAPPRRRSDPALIDRLVDEPQRFDFFQAVRLLGLVDDRRAPVGVDGPFAREAVRFVQHRSLSFPPSAVGDLQGLARPPEAAPPSADAGEKREEEAEAGEGASPPRMTTSFLGLIGPSGVLPTVYTEELLGIRAKRRGAAADFLDLFHHRLASFFYRAWEKHHPPTLWEKNRGGENGAPAIDDPFAAMLFHLLGLGDGALRDRLSLPDESLLFYTGLFAEQRRPAVMLERLLADYFGQPTEVLSFSGQWLRLRPEDQTRLGRSGAFNRLGVDAVAGRKTWDAQSKFRLRIGPLSFQDFQDFLPDGSSSAPLMSLTRFYVRGELDFDVQLILRREEVPACRISRGPGASRLGRSAWLKRREFQRDAVDAVFRPDC